MSCMCSQGLRRLVLNNVFHQFLGDRYTGDAGRYPDVLDARLEKNAALHSEKNGVSESTQGRSCLFWVAFLAD